MEEGNRHYSAQNNANKKVKNNENTEHAILTREASIGGIKFEDYIYDVIVNLLKNIPNIQILRENQAKNYIINVSNGKYTKATTFDILILLNDYYIAVQIKTGHNIKYKNIKEFKNDLSEFDKYTNKKRLCCIFISRDKEINTDNYTDENGKIILITQYNDKRSSDKLIEIINDAFAEINIIIDTHINDKFEFHQHQKELLDNPKYHNLPIYGIIHSATGTGKSVLALALINKFLKTGGNIIWIAEHLFTLSAAFDNRDDHIKKSKINFYKKNGILSEYVDIIDKNDNFTNIKSTIIIVSADYLIANYEKYLPIINADNFLGVIYDECHNLGNETYNKLYKIKEKSKIFIGLSATPDYKYKKLIYEKLFNVTNDTNILLKYSLLDAKKDNIISLFKFHYFIIKQINGEKYDNRSGSIINYVAKSELIQTFKSAVEITINGKCIVWVASIADANTIHDLFSNSIELNKYKFYKIHSDYNYKYNEWFESKENSIMIAVDMLKSALDLANITGVIFMDNVINRKTSTYLQGIGRSIRKCDYLQNKCAAIIELFIHDTDENMEERYANLFKYETLTALYGSKNNPLLKNSIQYRKINDTEFAIVADNHETLYKLYANVNTIDIETISAKMYTKICHNIDNTISWDEIKIILKEKNITTKQQFEIFCENKENKQVYDWWQKSHLNMTINDLFDLLNINMNDYYKTLEETIDALYKIEPLLIYDDVKNLEDCEIYENYARILDEKLPPEPHKSYFNKKIKHTFRDIYEFKKKRMIKLMV